MARSTKAPQKEAPDFTGDERICVLHGKESLLRREFTETLRKGLEEKHGEVQVTCYEGDNIELAEVMDELRTFSLMQTCKLVIVDRADEFVKKHRDVLLRYAEAPVDHATLLFRSDTWNKGNLDKAIAKVGWLHKCDTLSDAALKKWLGERMRTVHKIRIAPDAQQLLLHRLGHDLTRLDSEIAKLAMLAADTGMISAVLVDQVVARTSEEEAWAVQEAVLEALASGRGSGAMIEKLHEVVDLAGKPEVVVAYFLTDLAKKLQIGAQMKRRGDSPFVITRELNIWGNRQHTFNKVLERLDAQAAALIFDAAIAATLRSRQGLGEPMRNLECFSVTLADNLR